MTDPTSPALAPAQSPFASIPPQQSAVLRGIAVALVAQALPPIERWVQAHYQIDLSLAGVTADTIVSTLANTVSLAGALYAAHGRITKPMPAVHLNPFTPPVLKASPAPQGEISLKESQS